MQEFLKSKIQFVTEMGTEHLLKCTTDTSHSIISEFECLKAFLSSVSLWQT